MLSFYKVKNYKHIVHTKIYKSYNQTETEEKIFKNKELEKKQRYYCLTEKSKVGKTLNSKHLNR